MQRAGPAYAKVGAAVRYSLPDLDEFMERHRVTPKIDGPVIRR
jgi:hypothetical protein